MAYCEHASSKQARWSAIKMLCNSYCSWAVFTCYRCECIHTTGSSQLDYRAAVLPTTCTRFKADLLCNNDSCFDAHVLSRLWMLWLGSATTCFYGGFCTRLSVRAVLERAVGWIHTWLVPGFACAAAKGWLLLQIGSRPLKHTQPAWAKATELRQRRASCTGTCLLLINLNWHQLYAVFWTADPSNRHCFLHISLAINAQAQCRTSGLPIYVQRYTVSNLMADLAALCALWCCV